MRLRCASGYTGFLQPLSNKTLHRLRGAGAQDDRARTTDRQWDPVHRQQHRVRLAALRPSAQKLSPASPEPATARSWVVHTWQWQGHTVRYLAAGKEDGERVVLIHGFGASSLHWRNNIDAIAAAGFRVFSICLLGQGGSEKPIRPYTLELWRDQLVDFLSECVQKPAVLCGNSLGSLVALMVAEANPNAVTGLALLNCAGGLNNKAIADDWRIKLALPIFWLIDFILLQPYLAAQIFDRFRARENLRNVLKSVYSNQKQVDDELIDIIYHPSCDEGALAAFVSIITGPPGPRPDVLLEGGAITQPLLVLWGDRDTFTPADGPIGKYFQQLPARRPDTIFVSLPNVGHCPHDDTPDVVHRELLPWLAEVHSVQQAR